MRKRLSKISKISRITPIALSTLDSSQQSSSRQAFSKARRLDPRPMPSLPPTCIRSTIITGFLSLRMTPTWLCRASQRARARMRSTIYKHGRQPTILNRGKTKEIVFSARRKVALPPSRPDIKRVSSLRVLGVILNDKLTAADHVTALLSSGSSMPY